jgi:hypothetical protein
MSDYSTVQHLCRNRPRSKNARIVGGLIVGTAEPAATEKAPRRKQPFMAELECVTSHEHEPFVRLKTRLDRPTFSALCAIAKAENRSVESLLRRSLINAAKTWRRVAEKAARA